MYDYQQALKKDIIEYINKNVKPGDFTDGDGIYDYLYDEMFYNDDITGNGKNGQYSKGTEEEIEVWVRENSHLIRDFAEKFGYQTALQFEYSPLPKNPTWADTIIRCCLFDEIWWWIAHNELDDSWFYQG